MQMHIGGGERETGRGRGRERERERALMGGDGELAHDDTMQLLAGS